MKNDFYKALLRRANCENLSSCRINLEFFSLYERIPLSTWALLVYHVTQFAKNSVHTQFPKKCQAYSKAYL